jgi:hypothetical protein
LCAKGETYLVPSGPDLHLFVVVTDEDANGMHILINITSIDPEIIYDETCKIDIGDHPFVTKASYVAYEYAIERHKNFVDRQAKLHVYRANKPASAALVTKICDGIKKSKFTPRAVKDCYDATIRAAAKRNKQNQSK